MPHIEPSFLFLPSKQFSFWFLFHNGSARLNRGPIRPHMPPAFQRRPKTLAWVEVSAAPWRPPASEPWVCSCRSWKYHMADVLPLITHVIPAHPPKPLPNFSPRHLFGARPQSRWCNCLKVIPKDIHLCTDGGRKLSAGTGINGFQAAITSGDKMPPMRRMILTF